MKRECRPSLSFDFFVTEERLPSSFKSFETSSCIRTILSCTLSADSDIAMIDDDVCSRSRYRSLVGPVSACKQELVEGHSPDHQPQLLLLGIHIGPARFVSDEFDIRCFSCGCNLPEPVKHGLDLMHGMFREDLVRVHGMEMMQRVQRLRGRRRYTKRPC